MKEVYLTVNRAWLIGRARGGARQLRGDKGL